MIKAHTDLAGLSLPELRRTWLTQFGKLAPAFRSRDLLARAFAYSLELKREGDFSPRLKKRLTELADKFEADEDFDPSPRAAPSPGSALVRDWNGVRHVVLVLTEGFQYGETIYPSLTHVAKTITGAHQSGPRFFGLSGPHSAPTEATK